MTRSTLYRKLRDVIALAQAEQLTFLAAAIAYYAFLSVVPLLIVGFAVATTIAGQEIATQVLTTVEGFLTPEASEVVERALLDAPGRGGTTLAGLVVLVWSSLRVFRGLDIAFSRMYGIVGPKSLLKQLRDAVLVLGAIGLAIAATAILGMILPAFDVGIPGPTSSIGLLVTLPVVFFPLYYVLPARDVTVREAIPGAVIAGIGWTLLGIVFGIYTTYAGGFELYGILAGVLILLVWFYFGGLVLLFGVAVNAVFADRFGDRQLQQVSLREGNQRATMGEADGPTDDEETPDGEEGMEREDSEQIDGSSASDTERTGEPTSRAQERRNTATREDVQELRRELDRFEEEIDERTVHRTELERNLKRYVRRRVRRGHATGWGPYLVLLYGTVMTLGAFYYLSGGWAVLAMVVIWLSTLGLYVLMLLVGVAIGAAGVPGRLLDKVRDLR